MKDFWLKWRREIVRGALLFTTVLVVGLLVISWVNRGIRSIPGRFGLNFDNADFDVWRTHFGQTDSGSGQSLSAAVPEPAKMWLIAISAAFVCHCLRRTT